jgi:hypothetical protein
MYRPEMREIPHLIQLVCHNCIPTCLHHVQVGSRNKVSCRKEVVHLSTDKASTLNRLLDVVNISKFQSVKGRVFGISNELCLYIYLQQVTDPLNKELLIEVTREHDILHSHTVHIVTFTLS